MDPRLRAALAAGHTIVTASARLARCVRLDLAREHAARDVDAWTPPLIVSWQGWLARLHEEARWGASGFVPVLLNPAQEEQLWEQIIGADDAELLLAARANARQAHAAWNLAHAWRFPDTTDLLFASEEARAFARWMRAYRDCCRTQGWLDGARLPDALRAAFRADVIAAPKEIFLHGFAELTPQQRALMRALEERGARIRAVRGLARNSSARRVELPGPEQELATAARWARALLDTGQLQRIGILVPRLSARRLLLQRVLDDALAPLGRQPWQGAMPRPCSLSVGAALAELPIVRTAGAVLTLLAGSVTLDAFSLLLRSPFVAGGITRAPQRAQFDAWLRRKGVVQLELEQVPRFLAAYADTRHERTVDLGLHGPVTRVIAELPRAGAFCTLDVWARVLRVCLQAFGWPGERTLNDVERAVAAAFEAAVERFAGMELVQGPVDARAAILQLTRQLESERLPAEAPDAPVQVLDLMDASGLEFDELWIAGMDDETWPPPAAPNPFLPIEWQRKHKIPGATPEGELERARELTQRLLASSGGAIVSHAVRDGDRLRGPSPLVRALPRIDPGDLSVAAASDWRTTSTAATLDVLCDEQAPELAARERRRGGTRVLKLQAACPFRAYGELRLHASALAPVAPGFDVRARGMLLHAALERLWRELRSSRALHALDDAALASLLAAVAEDAVVVLEVDQLRALQPRRRAVEIRRLVSTLRDWLALERERAPFEIAALEAQQLVSLGNLELRTRADRVDRLADDAHVIIDYKSGSMQRRAPACWMGERPDEPQVPLYALAQTGALAGAFIAHVRPGRPSFSGAARAAALVPAADAGDEVSALKFSALRTQWWESLGKLAAAYAGGDARVDPKYAAQTCRGCDLGALCRIAEQRAAAAEDRDG